MKNKKYLLGKTGIAKRKHIALLIGSILSLSLLAGCEGKEPVQDDTSVQNSEIATEEATEAPETTEASGEVSDVQEVEEVSEEEENIEDIIIPVDEEHFPDENFRQFISEECDKDQNGELCFEEWDMFHRLIISDAEISSLKGIEYFPYLYFINIGSLNITELDISENVYLEEMYIQNCPLENLDISNNPELVCLCIEHCNLQTLDISNNSKLIERINNETTIAAIVNNTIRFSPDSPSVDVQTVSYSTDTMPILDYDYGTELITGDYTIEPELEDKREFY